MPSKRKSLFKKPGFRLGMIASLVILALSLVCLGFLFISRSLFSKNDHFILRRVIVKSGGWWKSRDRDVCELLDLNKGESNLFAMDLPKAKNILEKEPGIAKASVYKILPDTLAVEIIERIPLAFLYRKGNKIVVDGEAVVMPTSSCVNVPKDLPVISGFRAKSDDLMPGSRLQQITPALGLLEKAKDECPRVMIRRISLSNKKEFNTIIFDRNTGKSYQVLFTRKNLMEKLAAMEPVLEAIAAGRGKNTRTIDMRFKGQAVLK